MMIIMTMMKTPTFDNDVTVILARPTLGATLVVGSRNGKAGQDCQVEEKTLMHQYPYQS